jgi:3-oxoacyl-[acyl-carrier-protein] synthase-3
MKWDNLFVSGVGSWLPAQFELTRAVREGLVSEADLRSSGQLAVRIAGDTDAPADMAVRAARKALRQSRVEPGDVTLVLHAACHFQGLDLWSPASYVQRATISGNAPAIELRQMSNGSMACLEIAASHLALRDGGSVLITAAERFSAPSVDRWRSDRRAGVLSDGAGSLVLSKGRGFARLLATASHGEPRLEGMVRGEVAFQRNSTVVGPDEMERRKQDFVSRMGMRLLLRQIHEGIRATVQGVLDETDTQVGDLTAVVVPHVGRATLKGECLRPLGIDLLRTTWPWARAVGHVGAADQLLGLEHLVDARKVHAGDRVLMIGFGAGVNWTAALLAFEEDASTSEPRRAQS